MYKLLGKDRVGKYLVERRLIPLLLAEYPVHYVQHTEQIGEAVFQNQEARLIFFLQGSEMGSDLCLLVKLKVFLK